MGFTKKRDWKGTIPSWLWEKGEKLAGSTAQMGFPATVGMRGAKSRSGGAKINVEILGKLYFLQPMVLTWIEMKRVK